MTAGQAQTVDSAYIPAYHRDTGCEAATRHLEQQAYCLSCPFNRCLEDNNKGGPRGPLSRTVLRDNQMRAAEADGNTLSEIAILFGLPYKTVWTALRRKDR